jgi:hypothetical protein
VYFLEKYQVEVGTTFSNIQKTFLPKKHKYSKQNINRNPLSVYQTESK